MTNPPPLGIGVLAPTAAPLPTDPDPLLAGPGGVLIPTPQPSAVDVPRALAQSVPARKYGLPGALAVVVLGGVAVGVVRLARVEFGNGHTNGHGGGHGAGPGSRARPYGSAPDPADSE